MTDRTNAPALPAGTMRVAVIGAGVSGLVNARVLHNLGVDVTVFEAMPDLGGVWSSTRRYPNLRIQNDKRTYALSDLRMPREYEEHPTSPDVQRYLSSYVAHHGLQDTLRLGTTVRTVTALSDGGWEVESQHDGETCTERFDWVVVANGMYSQPNVPVYAGAAEFEAAGGQVLHAGQVGEGDVLLDRDVTVIGWGKSAADIAVAAAKRSSAVHMLVRTVGWKLPYALGKQPFQRLVISRLGEHLLWAPYRTTAGRVLRRLDAPIRRGFTRALERRVIVQQQLERRGLVPDAAVEGFSHLATPGFFEAIDDGGIDLRTGTEIRSLGAVDGRPVAILRDGTTLATDLIVAATGYDQNVSFFDEATQRRLLNDHGELELYRHTLPEHVAGVVFAGWMNSFRSPISAEIQAIWSAALMHGLIERPSSVQRRRSTQRYHLTHERAAALGSRPASAGVSILDQDAWIREAGLRRPISATLREVLRPIDPASYADLHVQLRRRVEAARGTALSR